jgi:outer membrane protein assembly factor BamE (lipoprotein component of BamABCDE complex)
MRAPMGIFTRAAKRLTILCATLALAGCVAQFRNHGYVPSDEDLSGIIVGIDSRDSVEDQIGTPTTGGVLNGSGFYYVSSRWRHFGFLAPQIIDRQLVAITFDGVDFQC